MAHQFSSKWGQGIFKGFKTNAMSPLCWAMGFLELLFMYGFVYSPSLLVQIWSGILLSIGFLFICGMFFFFAWRDPDRLQSEEFLIEKQTMNALYESKGSAGEAGVFFNSAQQPKIQSSCSVGKKNIEDEVSKEGANKENN